MTVDRPAASARRVCVFVIPLGHFCNPGFNFFSAELFKPWGKSTRGYNTIKARTKEGLVIYMDILISYKLTTSNDQKVKATQLYNIFKKFEHSWDDMLYR